MTLAYIGNPGCCCDGGGTVTVPGCTCVTAQTTLILTVNNPATGDPHCLPFDQCGSTGRASATLTYNPASHQWISNTIVLPAFPGPGCTSAGGNYIYILECGTTWSLSIKSPAVGGAVPVIICGFIIGGVNTCHPLHLSNTGAATFDPGCPTRTVLISE